jgi:hypothetical protein
MKPLDEKAIRMVENGRVTVTWTGDEAGAGTVDGDTDTYQVQFSPAGYVCTCEAGRHHRVCSHAIALELAVAYALV